MNELQEFNFQGNQLRTVMIDSEPFFVGKDAATAIGYSNTRKAIRDHVKAKYQREERIVTPSGLQSMTVISEPGLYQLASESKLPSAGPFQDWVYEDVLPSIRKHGAYMTPETIEKALLNPDTIINLATQLKQERSGRLIAEQQVQELKPKADYYDMILASKGLVTTTSIAKNYGVSAKRFNAILHSWGVQYKQSGSWYLYSKYQGHGYTHTVPVPYVHSDGQVDIQPSTKWTQKGHKFIYEFLKARGILPVIERETEEAK
ncbi:phage antirepressor [Schleiferilactobacillus harbinensis]|uniref:phage antirepressor n=1 Tax=Schleiferilactobacillus harbinensis TaxID=304207 RepID=UPI0039E7DF18